MIWVVGFASQIQFLKGLDGVEIPASEEEKQRLCELVVQLNVGSGTAIHDSHKMALEQILNRIDSIKSKGVDKLLLASFTDGQDNSGEYSWNAANYKVDGGVTFRQSLDHLFENYIKPINKEGIKVEVAFHGISNGADWNILRVLNDYPNFNSSGRVIQQDGNHLMKGFQAYINNFMCTASTNNKVVLKLDPVSEAAGVRIRFLDPSNGMEDSKNDFGAKVITSPWRKSQDFRMLGDFSRGKEYSVMFQLLFDMKSGEDGKFIVNGFPKDFDAVAVTADLTGNRVPGMKPETFKTIQIKVPIIWDPKITQFDQVADKWQLRLEKHWIAIRSMMTKAYDLGDGKKTIEMIDDEINAIKKDQDQCYRDNVGDAAAKTHDEMRLKFPFYDPVETNREVAQYTRLIEDLRIMKAYLLHPNFRAESGAKMFEFLLPERRGEKVTTLFNSYFMSEEDFKGVYESLMQHKLEDEWEVVEDDFNAQLIKKFKTVAKLGFKKQQEKKDKEYDREVLVAFVYVYLMKGLTPEEMEKVAAAAIRNQTLGQTRYIKRQKVPVGGN